jgi:hypothetical protein
MSRWLYFVLAFLITSWVHEGTHVLIASVYDEYQTIRLRPLGLEVVYKSPVPERTGIQWAAISGSANAATLLCGYLLLAFRARLARWSNRFLSALAFWVTVFFLVADALNLSLGPLIYGGDADGIAIGLGINRSAVQVVFLLVLLLNRELIAGKLLPAYGVVTTHPLFRTCIKRR